MIHRLLALIAAIIIILCGCTANNSQTVSYASDSEPVRSSGNSINSDVQDTAFLDTLTVTYVRPLMPSGAILLSSWETAEEIAADELVEFCAFNNLLNKPVTPSDATIYNGAVYVDHEGAADEVENAIQKYFDVSKDYLRTSKLYNFYDQETNVQYKDAYMLPDGFGGGSSIKAMAAEQSESQLLITVGIFSPDDLKKPAMTGVLTVRLEKEGFKYVSYSMQEIILNVKPLDTNTPIIQDAFLIWKSFGGSPGFTNVNAITSALIGELYANYCNSNAIPIDFSIEESNGMKWMKSKPVEKFAKKYFDVEPDKLHGEPAYDEQKGYQYPLVFPAAPESVQILSAERISDKQISIKMEYTFYLPPEFYSKPGKVKATHTVIISVENSEFTFISADIDDDRLKYKE